MLLIFGAGCGEKKESKEPQTKEIEALTIDEIINNLDKYIDKEVTVIGYAPKKSGYGITSDMNEIYSEDFSHSIDVSGIDEPLENGYEITITGTVKRPMEDISYIEVKEYSINKEVVKEWPFDESEDHSYYDGLTFADKQFACQNYSNMNWDSFYRNPTSFADDQLYYFVGIVIDDDGDSGLMRFADGDNRTIVQYTGTNLNFLKGDLVAVYATVNEWEGSWINTKTGDETSCPSISIVEYQCGAMEFASLSSEEADFIYDHTYTSVDGIYETVPGDVVKLTENKIAGYPYTLKSMEYFYGDNLVSSYDVVSNDMEIILSIDVDAEGETIPMLLYFKLDGTVKFSTNYNSAEEYYRE